MLTYKFLSPEYMDMLSTFDCSDEISVELFLKEQAMRLHQPRSAVTRLYFDESQNLIGYFTLYNDHVHVFTNQERRHGWNLPREVTDLFPAVKLHYLGVDRRFRGQGYGAYLLAEAVIVIEEIARHSGCNFITVEALTSAIDFYEKFGFVKRMRQPGSGDFYNMVLKLNELEF